MDGLIAIPLVTFYGVVAGLLLLAALTVWSGPTFAAIRERAPMWRVFVAALSSAGFWVALIVLGLSYYALSESQSYWVPSLYVGGAIASLLIGVAAIYADRRKRRRKDAETSDISA